MAIVSSSPQQATATTVRSNTQAATATTGRVRSPRTTRTWRVYCTSTQTTCTGATTYGTMGYPCGQSALRIYPLCLKQAKETKQAMNTFGGFCGAGARGEYPKTPEPFRGPRSELPSPLCKISRGAGDEEERES